MDLCYHYSKLESQILHKFLTLPLLCAMCGRVSCHAFSQYLKEVPLREKTILFQLALTVSEFSSHVNLLL